MGIFRSKENFDFSAIRQGLDEVRVEKEEIDYLARVTYCKLMWLVVSAVLYVCVCLLLIFRAVHS